MTATGACPVTPDTDLQGLLLRQSRPGAIGPLTVSLVNDDSGKAVPLRPSSPAIAHRRMEAIRIHPENRRNVSPRHRQSSRHHRRPARQPSGSISSRSSRPPIKTAPTATASTSWKSSPPCIPPSFASPAAIISKAITSPSATSGRRPSAPRRPPHASQPLALPLLRRHGPPRISGLVRRPEHAARARRLRRLLACARSTSIPAPPSSPTCRTRSTKSNTSPAAADTKWGAERAKDGHPAPFTAHLRRNRQRRLVRQIRQLRRPLSRSSTTPSRRNIPTCSSSPPRPSRASRPTCMDDHYYVAPPKSSSTTPHHYDNTDRNGPKIFVGEWATREGAPTPNSAPPSATPPG